MARSSTSSKVAATPAQNNVKLGRTGVALWFKSHRKPLVLALWALGVGLALQLVAPVLASGSGLSRPKRALFEYADGVEQILGPGKPLKTSFNCDGLGYGYYADPETDCKVFHVCQSFKMADGSIQNNHWSFFCPNQTTFNQVSLSCAHPEDAIPCESAREFYYVNDYFGDASAQSVKDADLVAAQELVARAYGSRLDSQTSSEPRRRRRR